MWLRAVSWSTFFHGLYDFVLMNGLESLGVGADDPEVQSALIAVLKVLLIPTILAGCFLRARWDYIKLAAVPRVDIRDLQVRHCLALSLHCLSLSFHCLLPRFCCLQARGILPKATFCGWLRDGVLCCNWPCQFCCRCCRDEHDR